MSLSRKYRRAMERKLLKDKNPMAEIKWASSEVYERLHDRAIDKDTHDLVSAMYYLIGLALKQEYGFGATRVMRVYQNIDNQLEKWQTGELKSTDFRRMAMDELGIDLQIQWGSDGEETEENKGGSKENQEHGYGATCGSWQGHKRDRTGNRQTTAVYVYGTLS